MPIAGLRLPEGLDDLNAADVLHSRVVECLRRGDGGQIKEHGTHDELLKKHGLYAAMWDAGVNSATWTIRAGKEAVTE